MAVGSLLSAAGCSFCRGLCSVIGWDAHRSTEIWTRTNSLLFRKRVKNEISVVLRFEQTIRYARTQSRVAGFLSRDGTGIPTNIYVGP